MAALPQGSGVTSMAKETRIGVGVVGVLLIISMILLYGRMTLDRGPEIQTLNIESQPEDIEGETNSMDRHPTIERQPGAYPATSPVSPALSPAAPQTSPANQSFLPDPDSGASPVSLHNNAAAPGNSLLEDNTAREENTARKDNPLRSARR